MVSRRIQLSLVALCFASVALYGQTAHAATYYVATNGQDAYSCAQAQSESSPKQTLNNASGCLAAGDTLLVRGGTYPEALAIGVVPSGTSWASKVTIAAYTGETVTMQPTSGFQINVLDFGASQHYIEFDHINLNASLLSDSNIVKVNAGTPGHDAHHIRVRDAELIGFGVVVDPAAKVQGVLSTNGDGSATGGNEWINLKIHAVGFSDFSHPFYINDKDTLIEGCEIYDFSGLGVHLYNGYGLPFTGTIVRNNIIHDARRNGAGQRHAGIIVADGAVGAKIYNNLVYNIPDEGAGSWGIIVYTGRDADISYNTVFGIGGEGVTVEVAGSGTIFRNNVSYNQSGNNYRDSGSGTQISNNSFSGVDPKFVNAAAGDFHLNTASPLINAAASVAGITTDLAQAARPQGASYDVGAYQFVGTSNVSIAEAPTSLSVILN